MRPNDRRTVADVGELELVAIVTDLLASDDPRVECGPGDDAAIVTWAAGRMVLTSDSQREGVHYWPRWIDASDLGRRALAVSVSDLAAMGAEPVCALCTLALPASTALGWVREMIGGLAAAAVEFDCPVVGGDVSRSSSGVSIEIAVVGSLPDGRPATRRSGAEAGDGCWVTGVPGLAAAGRAFLQDPSRSPNDAGLGAALAAYRRPSPPWRFGAAVAELGLVAAAMDISDGLGIDAGRLCKASEVGLMIQAELLVLPLHELSNGASRVAVDWALGGGDDYQLLCAVKPECESAFQEEAQRCEVEVRRIGTFAAAERGVFVRLPDGSSRSLDESGWDHFAGESE